MVNYFYSRLSMIVCPADMRNRLSDEKMGKQGIGGRYLTWWILKNYIFVDVCGH